MKKNEFSWTQGCWGLCKLSPSERRKHMQSMLRDINLDVGEGRLKFRVVDVEPAHRRQGRGPDGWTIHPYRIKLIASTSAIEKMTRHWGSGQYFTVNGKRKKT